MLPDHAKTGTAAVEPVTAFDPQDELRIVESGLDALQSVIVPRHDPLRRILWAVLPTTALLIVLMLAWQAGIWITRPRPDIVPSPADVAEAFRAAWDSGQLQLAVSTSLSRGAVGFTIAILIGTPLGLALAEFRLLRRALGPLISGLQVLPSVAWVPAAILWFGLSDGTVYFVVLMGAIPSIVNGLLTGVDQVPPELRRAGKVLGSSRRQLAIKVLLPAALPGYFGGLKQGWAFSWRSLMAAEIIVIGGSMGFGLGSMLQQNRELANLAGVLTTVMTILVIGIIVELLVFAPIEREILTRRGLRRVGNR